MKILHVIDSEGIYGAEMVLLNLMEEQKKLGYDPWLCSIGSKKVSEKDLEREARKKSLKVKAFRFRNGPNMFGAYKILAFAQHTKFDIIHSHGYKSNILLGFIPRAIRKIPLIATIHGWTNTRTLSRMKIYEWFDLKSLKRIDAVIAVSQAMLSNPKFAGMNVLVINNGILSQNAKSLPISADDPIRTFCKSGFIIGSIGRLSEEKGHKYLINAFKLLLEKKRDVKLVIIGEGPERQCLEDHARKLGIVEHLFLPGYISNAWFFIRFFNVFVLPSLTEGMPITILEAMQAGATIVATEVGGVPELLGYGAAGFLVKPKDDKALADAIESTWQQPGTCADLSNNARMLFGSKYSREMMAEKYREIYDKVINYKNNLRI